MLEERKHQMDGSLHLFVRVQNHLAYGIIHQSYWQAKAQFSQLGFRQLSTQAPLPEPMKLSLTHGAFEAE